MGLFARAKPQHVEPKQIKPITISAHDTMLERAEKIWRLLGFANDRFGQAESLAAYLGAYRELDDKLRAMNEKEPPPSGDGPS